MKSNIHATDNFAFRTQYYCLLQFFNLLTQGLRWSRESTFFSDMKKK